MAVLFREKWRVAGNETASQQDLNLVTSSQKAPLPTLSKIAPLTLNLHCDTCCIECICLWNYLCISFLIYGLTSPLGCKLHERTATLSVFIHHWLKLDSYANLWVTSPYPEVWLWAFNEMLRTKHWAQSLARRGWNWLVASYTISLFLLSTQPQGWVPPVEQRQEWHGSLLGLTLKPPGISSMPFLTSLPKDSVEEPCNMIKARV